MKIYFNRKDDTVTDARHTDTRVFKIADLLDEYYRLKEKENES